MTTSALLPHVLGCLLGGAVGDALGNPIEFRELRQIRQEFGPDGLASMISSVVTDDTQMTLFTAEGLIRARLHGGDPVISVRNAYLRWLDTQDHHTPPPGDERVRTGRLREQAWLYARRAPGNTCLSGLRSEISPVPSSAAPARTGPVNPGSKGCGTVMRSAPFGFVDRPFELAASCAQITHGHPTAADASGALALVIEGLVHGEDLREAVTRALGHLGPDGGETASALRSAVELAATGRPSPEKVEQLGGGWIAEEALAIAVYCALAEPDPRKALLLSVNHSGDSDSTGAVCGNILGTWYGIEAMPSDWVAAVEGRDTITEIAEDFTTMIVTQGLPAGRAAGYPAL